MSIAMKLRADEIVSKVTAFQITHTIKKFQKVDLPIHLTGENLCASLQMNCCKVTNVKIMEKYT